MLAHRLEVEDQDRFYPMTKLFNGLLSSLKAHETNAMSASDLERLVKEQCQNIGSVVNRRPGNICSTSLLVGVR